MNNPINRAPSSTLQINEDLAGQRIDNFLFNTLKRVPKSHVYKLLRSGDVKVNKKRVAPSYKLQPDDLLRLPPLWQDSTEKQPGRPSTKAMELLTSRIIYEDASLLAINKPSGIASHGGSGINFGVIETLRHARPDIRYLELVHRLDRDTSGCLLLAKKRSMLRVLHAMLRESTIKKCYVALLRGSWQGDERQVDAPLRKNQVLSGERMVKVDIEGKLSTTIFRPLQIFTGSALMEVELLTGRTHQIRVHAAHIGQPVAGDEKYGDKLFNQQMKTYGLSRLFLHSRSLCLQLPDGKMLNITAELDTDLQRVVSQLA